MPISHKHKCIFIHIPKNGGTTIEDYLGIEGKDKDIIWYDEEETPQPLTITFNDISAAWRHLPAATIKELYPDIFSSYYKFAFVRNPYDRVISEYLWQKRKNKKFAEVSEKEMVSNFTIWIKHVYKNMNSHKNSSQCRFLYDVDGKLLVDEIFVFEKIKDELPKLFKKLKISPAENIHLNKSRFDVNRVALLTDENREFIYNAFHVDFAIFNYPKDYTPVVNK